jgi:hypothetical protein
VPLVGFELTTYRLQGGVLHNILPLISDYINRQTPHINWI